MAGNYISISYTQLALAPLFILINIGLSFALNLGLAKSLLIASLRMVVQLLLVGYLLQWVFTLSYTLMRSPQTLRSFWAVASPGCLIGI